MSFLGITFHLITTKRLSTPDNAAKSERALWPGISWITRFRDTSALTSQNLSVETADSKSSSSTSRYFCNADKVLCLEIFWITYKCTPEKVDLYEACAVPKFLARFAARLWLRPPSRLLFLPHSTPKSCAQVFDCWLEVFIWLKIVRTIGSPP